MWLASFCFQKVQQPKIPNPLAKVVEDTLVNLHSEGFCCPSLIWVEPIRVEILKFSPLRFSDSEPRDPIFISLPCAEALDQEGNEEAP